MAVLRRTWLAAARLASRALAAWITRAAIASPTLRFLSRKSSSRGRIIDSTSERTSGLFKPSLGLPLELGLVDADREDGRQALRGCPRP